MGFIEQVSSTIKKYSMLSEKDRVLVGLSGGPDSVSLLIALKRLQDTLSIRLYTIYIDHGLRPKETANEIEFCKSISESLGVGFTSRAFDVKGFAKSQRLNLQEAGRILRYRAFEEESIRLGANRIALGHTLNDQIETFLIRLLRGAGLKGLSGIPPVRGKIIRPLIETKKEEILEFLKEEGISYMVDSSNLEGKYLRNRLREEIIPVLLRFNPNLIETLSNTIDVIGEEDRYLELIVTKTLMRLISRKDDASVELFLQPLENLDRVILRRVLRRAISETRGLSGIGFSHIESIINLIKEGASGDRLYIPKGIRAIKKYSTLLITSNLPLRLSTYRLEAGSEVFIKEAGLLIVASLPLESAPIQKTKDMAVFDAEKLTFPLIIRARADGDFFYPEGFGKRKKLQDYFVDEKIPRDERDSIPIITSGKDIIWVLGLRKDQRFLPDSKTNRFITLTIRPAQK